MTVADQPADLVLTGGPVTTMDAVRRTAEACAVRDGRIVAVGLARDIGRLVGPGTRRIDLAGRMLLPGFGDAHVHPTHAGLYRIQCGLHDVTGGAQAVVAAVKAYADAHPDLPWILGGGWYMADFPHGTPSKELLDAVVPDRPVVLSNRDGHGSWANSRALELAGISSDTPDPADGRIERTEDGEPQGTLHEGAADLVERHAPPRTARDLERGLLEAQRYLHAFGITNWQDAWIEDLDDQAYRAVAGRGELTARVVGALWWDRSRGLEQIDDLVAWRARGPVGRYATTSVKLMLDGVVENFTAALTEPYLDDDGRPTDNAGIDFIDRETLIAAVTRLDALGFQPHFHALGDRAVRHALDAVEAARLANGWSDSRPHAAHIQVVHPDDIPRFRRVGMVANAQPLWACHEPQMDRLTIPYLAGDLADWQYPFASLRRAGAQLAMGSDWSVSSPNVLSEVQLAVTRTMPGWYEPLAEWHAAGPLLASEQISLQEALEAFTLGTAYVNHLDDVVGSIEVGKLADLVVVDRDLFAVDPGMIGQAEVLGTFVEGVPVFEAPSLEG